MHSRKTLYLLNSEPWVKKEGNKDFDALMGCYDGAEICELVGSFRLNQLGIFCKISKPMWTRYHHRM